MIHRCLSCYTPFPANRTLEGFRHGRRIAFDPARGRLWVVCPACARWSLTPIETRWETLEALERLVEDGARLLKRGENIALFESGDLEIVRIGRAARREEAWWRYGTALLTRRARARRIARRGRFIDGLTTFLITGIPYWGHSHAGIWIHRARRRTFGLDAWRGLSYCPGCGEGLDSIRFEEGRDLYLEAAGQSYRLWYWCAHCGPGSRFSGHSLSGLTAEHVLRRTLAYENFAGGSEVDVGDAMTLVGRHASPDAFIRGLAEDRVLVGRLGASHGLAAEIALNSGIEASMLEAELSELEARWREEEELAAIIDGELTPIPQREPGEEGHEDLG